MSDLSNKKSGQTVVTAPSRLQPVAPTLVGAFGYDGPLGGKSGQVAGNLRRRPATRFSSSRYPSPARTRSRPAVANSPTPSPSARWTSPTPPIRSPAARWSTGSTGRMSSSGRGITRSSTRWKPSSRAPPGPRCWPG